MDSHRKRSCSLVNVSVPPCCTRSCQIFRETMRKMTPQDLIQGWYNTNIADYLLIMAMRQFGLVFGITDTPCYYESLATVAKRNNDDRILDLQTVP